MNPNKLLGVTSGASAQEIQTAFRKAAMEVHPDHNTAPEAAEAFSRIKRARDELMRRAETASGANRSDSIHHASSTAAAAAGATAFAMPIFNDPYADMSAEEIAHIQKLDQLVQEYQNRSFIGRRTESEEARRHRRAHETKNKRIMGKY